MKLLKKLAVSALFFSAALILPASVYAYNVPDTIRVGLEYRYKEVESVEISNKSLEVGFEEYESFVSEAEISASGTFSIKVPSSTVGDTDEYFKNYDDAYDYARELCSQYGVSAVPAMTGMGEWGVYIADATDSQLNAVSAKSVSSTSLMVLYDGNNAVMAFDGINAQFKATDNADEVIILKDRSYRGVMEFGRYSGKKITAVNVVPFDYYLYSVVPSEMPSTWEEEAIKAQTVAARSYALTRIGVHSDSGYDVCDGTNCQVYLGYTQERENVNKAIDDTDGKVALYNGEPINAVFFSSSGGSTDNSENVWANEVPYLRAVKEINEEKRTWTRTFSADDIKKCLAAMNINIGTIKNMQITSVGEYGRVQAVTVTGSSGTYTLEKEECRTFAASTPDGSLLSRMYTINGDGGETYEEYYEVVEDTVKRVYNTYSAVVNGYTLILPEGGTIFYEDRGEATVKTAKKTVSSSSSSSADEFVFSGAGSGHGVGMSQYGANGMAEKGYDYEEILKYYYTGIDIE